jgi:hypothetical protein
MRYYRLPTRRVARFGKRANKYHVEKRPRTFFRTRVGRREFKHFQNGILDLPGIKSPRFGTKVGSSFLGYERVA